MEAEQKHVLAVGRVQGWIGNMTANSECSDAFV